MSDTVQCGGDIVQNKKDKFSVPIELRFLWEDGWMDG